MKPHEKRKYEEFLDHAKDEDEAMWFWLRWKGTTDLFFLGNHILGWETAKHRKSRRKVIDPTFHRLMAKQMDKEEDSLLMYAREHLKTTWLRLKIIKGILENPYSRHGLWSMTATLSRGSLKYIKGLLRSQAIRDLWPEIVGDPKKWEVDNQDFLTMVREDTELQDIYNDAPSAENQIEVWGVESGVTGRRYDAMFYDDILDHSSVRTQTGMEKTRQWWTMMQPIQSYGAVEKMIGTHYHFHDLYSEIMDNDYFPIVEKTPALVNGKPVYSYFTKKRLETLRKRMGDFDFSCQYMLNPRPEAHRFFIRPYPVYEKLPDNPKFYIAIDPASTTNAWSDETGIAVACVDRMRPTAVFFVEVLGIKENPEVKAKLIVELIARYRPHSVGIETNLAEDGLYMIMAQIREWEQANGRSLPKNFKKIHHRNLKKADRINKTIAAMIRDSRAFFPEKWPKNHKLYEQFDFYNPNTEKNRDDMIDACSMIIQTIEHFSQGHWFGVEQEDYKLTWEALDEFYKKAPKRRWAEKIAV